MELETWWTALHFPDEKIIEAHRGFDDAEVEARNGKLSPYIAVNTALKLEQTMVESQFYEIVESDAKEFKIIAARLVAHSKLHLEKLNAQVGLLLDMGSDALNPPETD